MFGTVYSPKINPLNDRTVGPGDHKKAIVRIDSWSKESSTVKVVRSMAPVEEGDVLADLYATDSAEEETVVEWRSDYWFQVGGVTSSKRTPELGEEGERIANVGESSSSSAGIVRDPKTQLMWTKTDNGANIDWNSAKEYCQELSIDGIANWRMASIEELEALFDELETEDCGGLRCGVRLGIDLTGPDVWSSTRKGRLIPRAWRMSFRYGQPAGYPLDAADFDGLRVLCVRGSED